MNAEFEIIEIQGHKVRRNVKTGYLSGHDLYRSAYKFGSKIKNRYTIYKFLEGNNVDLPTVERLVRIIYVETEFFRRFGGKKKNHGFKLNYLFEVYDTHLVRGARDYFLHPILFMHYFLIIVEDGQQAVIDYLKDEYFKNIYNFGSFFDEWIIAMHARYNKHMTKKYKCYDYFHENIMNMLGGYGEYLIKYPEKRLIGLDIRFEYLEDLIGGLELLDIAVCEYRHHEETRKGILKKFRDLYVKRTFIYQSRKLDKKLRAAGQPFSIYRTTIRDAEELLEIQK